MITAMTSDAAPVNVHYQRPGWFGQRFNDLIGLLTRAGIGVWGARTLEVAGRKSGQPRRNPVNLLVVDGRHYLVAARGETEWVRNLRAAGGRLVLILGRRRQEWSAIEVADDAKAEILRSYLRRWKAEVGMFFDGADAKSSDEQLAAIAPRHPVFEITVS
jgi:deazaflavin-dependent oxidoreductase (nitroreductase family)